MVTLTRIGALSLACLSGIPGDRPPRTSSVTLLAVGAGEGLRSGYRLPVLPVAQWPEISVDEKTAKQANTSCPFEVRGIVEGEQRSDNFAVVVYGDSSRVIRRGESIKIAGTRWRVASVTSQNVRVTHHDTTMDCSLVH